MFFCKNKYNKTISKKCIRNEKKNSKENDFFYIYIWFIMTNIKEIK